MSACPWCRERLPTLNRPPACPHCAKDLRDAGGGELRPLDLDFEAILTAADESSLRWTKRSAVFGFVLAAVGLVPLVAPVAFVVLVIGQFVWVRLFIARRYRAHFGTVRRFTTRWITRLVLLLVVSPAHAAVLAPGVGLVVSPLLLAGTCWAARAYYRWHLLREHRRDGVHPLEKVFLVVLLVLFVLVLILFALLLWAGFSFLPD